MRMSNTARSVTLIYLFVSIIWIILSDSLVLLLPDTLHSTAQFFKGSFFVCLTALLIYYLIRGQNRAVEQAMTDLKASNAEMDRVCSRNSSMLDALPVAVVEVDFSEVKRQIDQVMAGFDGTLQEWAGQNPEALQTILETAQVQGVDGAGAQLFGAESQAQLVAGFKHFFTHRTVASITHDLFYFYDGETARRNETEFARADGSTFEASTFASLTHDSEQTWQRLIVVIEDITEKVEATKAVNGFFNLDVNLHCIADLDGVIHRVNQGWESTLGYRPEELAGRLFMDLVHPEDIEKTVAEMATLAQGKTTFFFENRYRDSQGEYHLLNWSAISPPDSRLIYAVATDVTRQRAAEEQLHQAAAIIENTSEGTMVTDLDGQIININPAFTTITGYSRDEVIGQPASILSSGQHPPEFYSDLWQALQTQGLWQGEIWNRNRAGQVYPEYLTINTLLDDQNLPTGYVGVFSDISAMKQNEDTIVRLSTQDALTGLPNARLFADRLQHSIDLSHRNDRQLALISLDLDNFKLINESLGFDEGDDLLRKVSQRLQNSVRSEDSLARFGGDEFKLLIEDCASPVAVKRVVEKLQAALKAPFQQNGQAVHVSASMGISLFPSDGQSGNELIRNADTALSQAKQQGSCRYQFYAKALTEAALESMFIENALRVAIEQQQLFLLYQPQFDLNNRQLIGLEALIRWDHPEIGIVSPMKFIPVAERTGMINEIGLWVLETACKQGKAWLDSGYEFGRIAVNVSGVQLKQEQFEAGVSEVLERTGFDPERLELEVTESYIMENAEQARETLDAIRATGIRVAIDDFGTGYSSLSYLKKLPIDKLKIDQSFVSELPDSSDGVAIIDAIISLGSALNMTLIAEGVEETEQEQSLARLGCHQVQGYLYSKPVRSEQITADYLVG